MTELTTQRSMAFLSLSSRVLICMFRLQRSRDFHPSLLSLKHTQRVQLISHRSNFDSRMGVARPCAPFCSVTGRLGHGSLLKHGPASHICTSIGGSPYCTRIDSSDLPATAFLRPPVHNALPCSPQTPSLPSVHFFQHVSYQLIISLRFNLWQIELHISFIRSRTSNQNRHILPARWPLLHLSCLEQPLPHLPHLLTLLITTRLEPLTRTTPSTILAIRTAPIFSTTATLRM